MESQDSVHINLHEKGRTIGVNRRGMAGGRWNHKTVFTSTCTRKGEPSARMQNQNRVLALTESRASALFSTDDEKGNYAQKS